MDPKQNGQPLDPKLQEVYDRVMGTNAAGTPSQDPANIPPQPSQPTPPPADPMQAPTPVVPVNPAVPPVTEPNSQPMPVSPVPDMPAQPEPMGTPLPTPDTTPTSMPGVPQMPTTPLPDTDDSQTGMNSAPSMPAEAVPAHAADTLNVTMSMPATHHESETVKIGMGGSPVATAVKSKGKGISPMILIFGAFAFLVVYAVFWVKFFGFSLPFLPQ